LRASASRLILLASLLLPLAAGPGAVSPVRAAEDPEAAAPLAVATGITASDTPNDWGSSLTVKWTRASLAGQVVSYEVWRIAVEAGGAAEVPAPSDSASLSAGLAAAGWEKAFTAGPEDSSYVDTGLSADRRYAYTVAAIGRTYAIAGTPSAPIAPARQYLSRDRINIMIAVMLFVGAVLWLVARARRGEHLFIRKIAGLEAVEEAVGRSTEMGRPILYVPGLDPMDEVATVAAIDILGQVAKKAAEYETKLVVPNRDPIVMAVAQQVVRESYSTVGKPHLYREENIFYVTYSQFGFAAAVAGLMLRDRPATNFFIGHFYAESLVLAETGNATGAIQIAGTDSDAQLPFFITSCDYTLIGEELYAGSVYLSRQPLLLGALKSQDYAKVLLIAAMVAGIVLSAVSPEIAAAFRGIFK
jgi:hypothetical protein